MNSAFITIGILQLFAVALPGPDFAIVVKNSLCHSRSAGLYTAIGIATGIIFHMTYCLFGLAILISHSVILFSIIKYIGAIYLVYIGIKSLTCKANKIADIKKSTDISYLHAFRQGFLCNVLNPKASLYFLGLFTLVIEPHTPLSIQLSYGIEMIVITFFWFSMLACLIGSQKIKEKLENTQIVISKLIGILLIIFGTKLALLKY